MKVVSNVSVTKLCHARFGNVVTLADCPNRYLMVVWTDLKSGPPRSLGSNGLYACDGPVGLLDLETGRLLPDMISLSAQVIIHRDACLLPGGVPPHLVPPPEEAAS